MTTRSVNLAEKLALLSELWCPRVVAEHHVLLVEPRGVVNTGDARGDLTARNDVWILGLPGGCAESGSSTTLVPPVGRLD